MSCRGAVQTFSACRPTQYLSRDVTAGIHSPGVLMRDSWTIAHPQWPIRTAERRADARDGGVPMIHRMTGVGIEPTT